MITIEIPKINESSEFMKFLDILGYYDDEPIIEFSKEKNSIECLFENSASTFMGKINLINLSKNYQIENDATIKFQVTKLLRILKNFGEDYPSIVSFQREKIIIIITKPKKSIEVSIPNIVIENSDSELIKNYPHFQEITKDSISFDISEEFRNDINLSSKETSNTVELKIFTDRNTSETRLAIENVSEKQDKFKIEQKVNLLNYNSKEDIVARFDTKYLYQILSPLKYTSGKLFLKLGIFPLKFVQNFGNISLEVFLAPNVKDD